MTSITVSLGERSYDVHIESSALDAAGTLLLPYVQRDKVVIITDENVAFAQLPRLTAALAVAGISVDPIILPPGEGTKSWDGLAALTDGLLERGVERSDTIIALGGGVIGDLVGFAAAILKRGCNFIQIPTTLLAQVDSSVGGKTAINSAAGKNLIGAFHQPTFVLIDPDVLDTLPQRQVSAGFAEVVKYGLMDDSAFFAWCEANYGQFFNGDFDAREQAIVTSVTAKARIVTADERELNGTRALLNLGHTFGHALEAETGFSDRLLHGEAVACGMALAFRYSVARGHCPAADADRVSTLLRAAKLPTNLREAGVECGGAVLAAHMAHDKKASGGNIPFLLARGIGETFLAKDVDINDVAAFLDTEVR
jgi:3-dehydroquinate synthase